MVLYSLLSFGFTFQHNGKEHAFHVLAKSQGEAIQKVRAMAGADFVGILTHEANSIICPAFAASEETNEPSASAS
ncbi:hypothetical protein GXW78_05055 [Roseomonas terrae]|uniref:DUF1508 domain-containing protein n=1 Tax=Neoroseomonas terrae TaxID=424799 RepID=A0ABS5EDC1_9PROT|nr:hypothetical protein [Neoroseomonas terrae]MBR0649021.1 hypothetical protein [Neoroseomonas terrae]